jgi:type IV pilus assembly protein PilC
MAERIRERELATLCRRMAVALESGIDVRRVLKRESESHSSVSSRSRLQSISAAIDSGDSLSHALSQTGTYFPEMVHELVALGEQTGHTPQVMRQLAEHYEERQRLRRTFRAAIAWPVIQLCLALAVIGLVILVLGVIANVRGNEPVDILGFGLVGVSGFIVYLAILAALGATLFMVVRAIREGYTWTRPIWHAVTNLPGVGQALTTLAMSRLAWALHLTLASGMGVLRAVPLALRSTHDQRYIECSDAIVAQLRAGDEIHEALAATKVFPPEFVDAVQVGEESGRLPESMENLSRIYQDQARRALSTIATLGGVGVWALVGLFIIMMIFRIFSFYLNTINDLL